MECQSGAAPSLLQTEGFGRDPMNTSELWRGVPLVLPADNAKNKAAESFVDLMVVRLDFPKAVALGIGSE